MNWRSIDFLGIVSLDQRIVNQLNQYLQEKEFRLAYHILNIVSLPVESSSSSLASSTDQLKLADAIEGFTKKVRLLNKKNLNQMTEDNEIRMINELNAALWEYTEVLEGCVVELFQQIKQVPINKWQLSFSGVVQMIKELLIYRLEDIMWAIRRLENPLKEYRYKSDFKSKGWKKWIGRWRSHLDPALLIHLSQSEKLLKTQYNAFNQRYAEYIRLSHQIEEILQKMKKYPILALLDLSDQNHYVDVFRLLKFYEFNPQKKGDLAFETIRSLRYYSGIEEVMRVFEIYYEGLQEAFFNSSLELKALKKESDRPTEGIKRLQEKIKEYQYELQQLIATMSYYREFMLATNSNPYMRSRWGFTEWVVGPEPPKAKELLHLVYSAEELKSWYNRFLISFNHQDPVIQQKKANQIYQEIETLLHEMGQTLISYSMIRNRAERLLKRIRECNEVGSPDPDIIHYIHYVLAKAMREDWKYHVLHEFPLFHEVYHIHQGLYRVIEDPTHAFRMERFYYLFNQIEEWVRKGDIYSHVHEIELDINDMKIYLQDFLAAIQRMVREKSSNPFLEETRRKFRQELLEYRYVFGQFFLNIMTKNIEGQQLRNRFLFVDQYFESVEILLHDMAENLEWKRSL